MQTSRFQLGLIATLAVGLGFSLASSDAVGYPAGAAVSMGSNPIWSEGGALNGVSSTTILTVDGDRTAIVSDVVLTTAGNCGGGMPIDLETADGGIVASFIVATDNTGGEQWGPSQVSHAFSAGVPVAAGETLTLSMEGGSSCRLRYTLSGYYAQP